MSNNIGRVKLSNMDLRENFKVAAIMLSKANNVPLENVNLDDLTQGFLRSPIDVTTSQAVFQFPMSTLDQASVTGAPNMPYTNLVASVDAFVAGMMAYYVQFYEFTGTQSTPNYLGIYNPQPLTYPSPFSNNAAGQTMSQGLVMLWLGYLKIEVNSKILYKQWDMLKHYNVPRTQSGGASPVPQLLLWNTYDGGNDAFFPMEPLPVFSGSKQNVVQMFLPANIPVNSAFVPFALSGYGTTFILKAVLHFRGITCQNASGLK